MEKLNCIDNAFVTDLYNRVDSYKAEYTINNKVMNDLLKTMDILYVRSGESTLKYRYGYKKRDIKQHCMKKLEQHLYVYISLYDCNGDIITKLRVGYDKAKQEYKYALLYRYTCFNDKQIKNLLYRLKAEKNIDISEDTKIIIKQYDKLLKRIMGKFDVVDTQELQVV